MKSVRIIVSTVVDSVPPVVGISPGNIAPVLWISPGVGGATAPVEGISPARAVPESVNAKRTAIAKCLILGFSFELRNASRLARKQHSVNTYSAIDTASRGMTNIRRW